MDSNELTPKIRFVDSALSVTKNTKKKLIKQTQTKPQEPMDIKIHQPLTTFCLFHYTVRSRMRLAGRAKQAWE